jgi:hypothetical protein
VLVLVLVVGVLGLLLWPAASYANGRARRVSCQRNLRALGAALHMYAKDHGGWLPGINTSAVALRTKRLLWQGNPDVLHDPALPVQTADWMTPLARYAHELPANRAERWHTLWTELKCPQQWRSAEVWSAAGAPDKADFEEFTWPAGSYLSPMYFSYWGQQHSGTVLAVLDGFPSIPVYAEVPPSNWPVVNEDYVSRLDRVGPPAAKVFAADGTRYVDTNGDAQVDVRIAPGWYGGFATEGPWSPISNAYGVREGTENWDGVVLPAGSESGGLNLLFSYRHVLPDARSPLPPHGAGDSGACQDNDGGIHALFFDAHVALLNDEESRTVSLWYPTGSVIAGDPVGMTTETVGQVIP